MSEPIEVIYEHGLLRPLGPLPEGIREHQRLTVPIEDTSLASGPADAGDDAVTLDAVRQALAKIPGSLAGAVIADRADR